MNSSEFNEFHPELNPEILERIMPGDLRPHPSDTDIVWLVSWLIVLFLSLGCLEFCVTAIRNGWRKWKTYWST